MSMITIAYVWDKDLKRFSAYIPDVAAYGEGATKEEALQSLKQALVLYIEEVGKEQFLSEVIGPVEYETLQLGSLV